MAADITVEAEFRGSSPLLLISLPIEIWTMLPRDNSAYSFVAHIHSGILASPLKSTVLSIRSGYSFATDNSPPRERKV